MYSLFSYSRRGSKVFSSVCVYDYLHVSVCLSVCPHDKTKTAYTKITKLDAGIFHHDTSPIN